MSLKIITSLRVLDYKIFKQKYKIIASKSIYALIKRC